MLVDEFYQPHLRNDGEEKPIGEEDVEEPADEDDDDGMALYVLPSLLCSLICFSTCSMILC
jgi:hypothetical protein